MKENSKKSFFDGNLMGKFMTIFMGNFMRFAMNCMNLICNPCIEINVSKVSNWSNENVKTGPCFRTFAPQVQTP
jgi:hypothetical protein